MTRIAVVDDDRGTRELLVSGLRGNGREFSKAASAAEALDLVRAENPEVLLLDIHLPDRSGMDLYADLRALDRRLPIIFMTADESGETVIEALAKGAHDYLVKPLDLARVRAVVAEALSIRRRMTVEVALSADEDPSGGGDVIVGRSPAMMAVYRAIARCAGENIPVLIRGESGTGKELVARAVYQHSKRREEPFLVVNCAALQESLLESELFGHEKGAFTGADRRRIGRFEQCDGGTIFLDEIGDMSPKVQAKVLRLLQEGEFQRLGGNQTLHADVRIISATHRPLEEMCDTGEFRLDLLHRLNGYVIGIPPLRERREDIPDLVRHFLARAERDLDLADFEGVTPDVLDVLRRHDWPGNVRQLERTIRQGLVDRRGPVLLPEFLPELLGDDHERGRTELPGLDRVILSRLDGATNLYAEMIDLVERRVIELCLEETRGNQSRAAEILGITRGKLRDRVKRFELDLDDLAGR